MVTQDQLFERGIIVSSTATAASTNNVVKRKQSWLDSDAPTDQDRCGELK